VSAKFDIGTFDDFSAKMQTPEDRKRFYDAVSGRGFDLGDYDQYESRLGKNVEVSSPGSAGTSATSVEPIQSTGQQSGSSQQPSGSSSGPLSGDEGAITIPRFEAPPVPQIGVTNFGSSIAGTPSVGDVFGVGRADIDAKGAPVPEEKRTAWQNIRDMTERGSVSIGQAIAALPEFLYEQTGLGDY